MAGRAARPMETKSGRPANRPDPGAIGAACTGRRPEGRAADARQGRDWRSQARCGARQSGRGTRRPEFWNLNLSKKGIKTC